MMGFTIFLFRLSPIVPNWLVNISSPLLGVPLVDFFMGTFIGESPFVQDALMSSCFCIFGPFKYDYSMKLQSDFK